MMERAPSTDAVGVVLRTGFRKVNCIPLTRSRARRSSMCPRARKRGSAVVTATACRPLASASERSSPQYRSAGGTVPKRRHQTSLCEQPHSFLFFKIEDHCSVVPRVGETVHHAVVACRCGRHYTGVATDDEWFAGDVHALTVTTGCHRDEESHSMGTQRVDLQHFHVPL